MSSVTTAPAPPPSTATVPRHPTAPPTGCQLGEPHRRFPCLAHLSHRLHALALDPVAREPPVSRGRPCHHAVFDRGDRAASRPRAHGGPWSRPGRCWATPPGVRPQWPAGRLTERPKPWAEFGPCAVYPFPFCFYLNKFQKLFQTSKIYRNL
jgi:hypothetical protein